MPERPSSSGRANDALKITVAQLRAFVATVDCRGFGRAATVLRTTQPAVSHAVTGMERLLGAPVLRRHPDVIPTLLGHRLLPHARTILAGLDAMAVVAQNHVDRDTEVVRLAAPATACHTLVPGWIANWREYLPEITVKIFEADDSEMTPWLEEDIVDAAVLINPDPWPDGGVVVMRDAYETVVHKDHPYAGEPAISIHDLLDDPVVVSTGGCYGDVMRICREADRNFRPAHRVRELGTLLGMVADHVGVTIMPSLGRSLLTPNLTMVPLDPVVRRTLVFTGPTGRPWNPVVTVLRDHLARQPTSN
ncbi:LysR family transcriptional regulator [Micromonospora sp. NPDC003197]